MPQWENSPLCTHHHRRKQEKAGGVFLNCARFHLQSDKTVWILNSPGQCKPTGANKENSSDTDDADALSLTHCNCFRTKNRVPSINKASFALVYTVWFAHRDPPTSGAWANVLELQIADLDSVACDTNFAQSKQITPEDYAVTHNSSGASSQWLKRARGSSRKLTVLSYTSKI
jgi:hypothetical protein